MMRAGALDTCLAPANNKESTLIVVLRFTFQSTAALADVAMPRMLAETSHHRVVELSRSR
jgi:hypothetical protein